ncbi:MAG: hypothetical protein JWL87_112 [Candidatus Adlerbacteria bacterium]|nr:hypothetical protein [Candidatus Adlerbacteria bacterium]
MRFWDNEEANIKRLWDYVLVQEYGTADLSSLKELPPDPLGKAFFSAIEKAFATKDFVPVDAQLVSYMAAWARDVAKGHDRRGGPLLPDHNHCVEWAFNAFIHTLIRAIEYGQVRYYDETRIMYGCFVLPQWLIDMCMDEVQERAERRNEEWDNDPISRPYILGTGRRVLLTAH